MQLRSLDAIALDRIGHIPPRNLLKLDVQGAELEVLAGMQQLVAGSQELWMLVEIGFNETRDAGVSIEELMHALESLGLRFVQDGIETLPTRALQPLRAQFAADGITRDHWLRKARG